MQKLFVGNGEVKVDADALELDGRVAMIQALIPIGLEAVDDVLQRQVLELVGDRYDRKDFDQPLRRWGKQKGWVHCSSGTEFNQCIVTHYPEGAGIGWHTEAPVFGDCIIGISLLSVSRFQFRLPPSRIECLELAPETGSLYIMDGPARWDYEHQLVKVKTERFSLTFRNVPCG